MIREEEYIYTCQLASVDSFLLSSRACEQVIVGDIQKKKKENINWQITSMLQSKPEHAQAQSQWTNWQGEESKPHWLLGLPIDACQCPVARPHAVLQWHDSGWLTSSDQPSFWRTNLIDEPRMAGAGHCKVGRAWLPCSTWTHPLCMQNHEVLLSTVSRSPLSPSFAGSVGSCGPAWMVDEN